MITLNENNAQEKSLFINTICGKYSNKVQAENAPRLFAHINIYFRLMSWSWLKGVSIYSEQSYEHSPWSPYRQAVHKLIIQDNVLIMQNYKVLKLELNSLYYSFETLILRIQSI